MKTTTNTNANKNAVNRAASQTTAKATPTTATLAYLNGDKIDASFTLSKKENIGIKSPDRFFINMLNNVRKVSREMHEVNKKVKVFESGNEIVKLLENGTFDVALFDEKRLGYISRSIALSFGYDVKTVKFTPEAVKSILTATAKRVRRMLPKAN